MSRRSRLPKALAVANGDDLDRVKVGLTQPPWPGWTPELGARRARKAKLHDRAIKALSKRLREKPDEFEHKDLLQVADKLDPDRIVFAEAKLRAPAQQTVMIVLVEE